LYPNSPPRGREKKGEKTGGLWKKNRQGKGNRPSQRKKGHDQCGGKEMPQKEGKANMPQRKMLWEGGKLLNVGEKGD